jgi:hypothetical protein
MMYENIPQFMQAASRLVSIEQVGKSNNVSESYVGGAWFESWLGHWILTESFLAK